MPSIACEQEIHLVRKLCQLGRHAQAYRRAKRASLMWPDVATFPRYAGIAATRQQRHDIAREQFKRAWKLAPNQPSFILNYGLSLLHCNLIDTTLELLATVEEAQDLPCTLLHLRAMAYYRNKNFAASLVSLKRALDLDPHHLGSLTLLVEVHEKLGNKELSSAVSTELKLLQPNWMQVREGQSLFKEDIAGRRCFVGVRTSGQSRVD